MSPGRRLVTFDCFDTVLTRSSGSPRAATQVVARAVRRRGLLGDDVAVVAAARVRAEDLCWHEAGDVGTLADVWAVAADLLHVSEGIVPDLVDVELDVERRVLQVVPGGAARVRRAREEGAQVGFLSDTLLSSAFLRERLSSAGVWVEGDEVWVSNELGASKHRGGAYAAVARSLGGTSGTWVHHGDSARADGTMARRSGVRAELVPDGRLSRYEESLDATAGGTAGLTGLLAGSARSARLGASGTDPTAVLVVTGLTAPLLIGFALWSLHLAVQEGRSRVHAEGRAALLLDDVLRRLVDALNLPLVVDPAVLAVRGRIGPRVVADDGGARPVLTLSLHDQDGPDDVDPSRTYLPQQVAGDRGRAPAALLTTVLSTVPGPDAPTAALVGACVEHLAAHLDLVDPWLDVREGLLDALAALWLRPTRAEVVLLAPAPGGWPAADLVAAPAPVRAARRGVAQIRRGRARVVRAGHQVAARRALRPGARTPG